MKRELNKEFIEKRMKELGLNITSLAAKMKMNYHTLYNWLKRGKGRPDIIALAEALESQPIEIYIEQIFSF